MTTTKKPKANVSVSQVTSEAFIEVLRLINQSFFRKVSLLIPVNQFSVLKVLEAENHLTMSELGERLHLIKQQMTPLIDKLVRMGYITRQTRPNDRRYIDLMLTKEGLDFIRKCDDMLRQKIEAGIASLSDEERAVFAKSTETFIPLMQKIANHNDKK